jgi:recombination protein RecA
MSKSTPIKWHPKMAGFLTTLEKRLNLRDTVVEWNRNLGYINTGSTVLNLLIGGTRLDDGSFVCPGWPCGRISEIYGRESSGKSTIALMGLGHALQANNETGTGLYVDLEHAVVDAYAMRLGADFRPPELGGTGRAIRVAPRFAEEVEAIVNAAAIQGINFIVIDSVAGLQPKREGERNVLNEKEKQGIAEVPRFMSNWMPKLQSIISNTGTHVMFLNQTRDKIGAIGFSEEALKTTTGGNALKFWSSNRVLLKPKQTVKAKRWNPLTRDYEEVPIATDVEIKNIKNKIDARTGHSGLITIRYGVGIDELRTMLNVAIAYDIVKKSKNAKKQDIFRFHSSAGEIETIGIEKFRAAMVAQPKVYAELSNLCVEHILKGLRYISDEELAELAEDAMSVAGGNTDDAMDQDYGSSEPPEVVPAETMGIDESSLSSNLELIE